MTGRAVVAGAVVMLAGVWMMSAPRSMEDTAAIVAGAVVAAAILLGVDWRPRKPGGPRDES